MPEKKPPQLNTRTSIVWAFLMGLILVILASQIMTGLQRQADGDAAMQTDELLTSDFISAVNEYRVQEVTFEAGNNALSGKYFPAQTAGGTIVDAYNKAISAMNSALGTMKTKDEKPISSSIELKTLPTTNIGDRKSVV